MHLSPQGKANKTLIYFTTKRSPVGLEDRGDVVCVHWAHAPKVSVRVEVNKSAGEVENTLTTFLEARPVADSPPGHNIPEWRQ